MPVYEGYCQNLDCKSYRKPVEFIVKHWNDKSPDCPSCRVEVHRNIGTPNVIGAKPLGWYDGESGDGHMVYGKDGDGKPIQRFITSRQEQLAWCREQGLYDPMDIPRDVGLDDNGKEEQAKKGMSAPAWI